ncbi:MAG: hypothetical protein H0X38_06960 [Planctomycetes bacterium]|nr:hypothetical protein [Planctomycetota bacterium]
MTSTVSVTVPQRVCGIDLVAPPSGQNDHQQFIVTGRDQFDHPMAPSGPTKWTVSGGGSINESGLFTAEKAEEVALVVSATCGTFTRKAQIIVRSTQLIVVCGPDITFNFQPVPYTITVSGDGRVPLKLGDHALFSTGETTLLQEPRTTASYIIIRPSNAGAFSFDIGDAVP